MRITFIICVLTTVMYHRVNAQDTTTRNFYREIKNYDLSFLWISDSIITDTDIPEPIGFIGDSFQRFFIHFTAVKKNHFNHYIYNVEGKTKVKDLIHAFHGTITILSSEIGFDTILDDPKVVNSSGIVRCEILFYEDKKSPGSGKIEGELETNFYFDKKNVLRYDSLGLGGMDTYCNNQFRGTWTSYKTLKKKKCNWGDFRIPESDALDGGVGEFVPEEKYYKRGWDTYQKAFIWDDPNASQSYKAMKIEEKQWWK